jgi:peptidoglycan/LPS O-acetylase OafA/YrhL
MPQLDVLRGLAIAMVVVYHGIFYSQTHQPGRVANEITRATQVGAMGVNLFFVLSGFLITGILLDAKGRPGYFSNFYVRRALRILPAYWLTIVALVLLHVVSRGGVAVALTFLANTNLFAGAQKYLPFWSLSVEEQFYLAWPLVVLLSSRRALGWLAGALCVLEPVLRGVIRYGFGVHPVLVHGATFLIGDNFAWGVLVAMLVRSRYGTVRNARVLAAALAVIGGLILVGGRHDGLLQGSNVAEAALGAEPFELIFTAMLLGLLSLHRSVFAGPVFRPMRWLGDISYGLYLVHTIVFAEYDRWRGHPGTYHGGTYFGDFGGLLMRLAVCGAVSCAIAWVSRRWYEEPFLRVKGKLAPRGGGRDDGRGRRRRGRRGFACGLRGFSREVPRRGSCRLRYGITKMCLRGTNGEVTDLIASRRIEATYGTSGTLSISV